MVDMGQRIHSCANLEQAKGFLDGIEFTNNPSLRVTGCKMNKQGWFTMIMEDADYDGQEEVVYAHDPVDISLEVLRED